MFAYDMKNHKNLTRMSFHLIFYYVYTFLINGSESDKKCAFYVAECWKV